MEEERVYPDRFLRGISDSNHVKDNWPTASTIEFYETSREDRMAEASINWLDDEGAREALLTQEKNGRPQFKYG